MPISPPNYPTFGGSPDFTSNPWVLFDPARIAQVLPQNTPSWTCLQIYAMESSHYSGSQTMINVGDKDDQGSRIALAAAVVGIATDNEDYINTAYAMLKDGTFSHHNGPTGPNTDGNNEAGTWGIHLPAYVGAWDLVKRAGEFVSAPITIEAAATATIQSWLVDMYDTFPGIGDTRTLKEMAQQRPMNLGSHARAGVAALAVFFKKNRWLEVAANSHNAWGGDNNSVAYQNFNWHSNDYFHPGQGPPYYGIVPKNLYYDTSFSGTSLWTASGCQPEEARRNTRAYGPTFHWRPPETNYYWEGLQGAAVCAHILSSHGYGGAFHWNDQAMLRASLFNYDIPRLDDGAGQEDVTDLEGITPEAEDAPLARVLDYMYLSGKGASIPATYTGMRGVVGLDWYYGV